MKNRALRLTGGRRSGSGSRTVMAVVEMMEQRMLLSAGALDTTFGKGGIAAISPPTGDISMSGGMAVQADGKILDAVEFHSDVNGFPTVSSQIRRFLVDGSLDASFGVGGIVSLPIGDHVAQLLVQPDGRIVLAGNVLGRLNTDGSLDTTFAGGKGIEPIVTADAVGITSAALQPNGGIIVNDSGINRFNSDGSEDMTFGQNGVASIPPASAQFPVSTLGGITTDSTGRIIVSVSDQEVAADPTDDIRTTYGVVRLLANGLADSSFGSGGLSLDENSTDEGFADDFDSNDPGPVAVSSDGTIYQIGNRPEDVGEIYSEVFAYSPSGMASSSVQNFSILGPANLIVQPDGKLDVFSQNDLEGFTLSVYRFLPYSQVNQDVLALDSSFNGNGEKDIQLSEQPSSVLRNIGLDGNDRIVLSADVTGSTDIVRLNGDSTRTASGTVFNDTAGGGNLNGDSGLAGEDVYADLNNNGKFDIGEPETSTASNGSFTLGGLPAGAVVIRQVVAAGERQTFPGSGMGEHVTIGSTPITGANFGVTTRISVSGNVFNDLNGNGKMDGSETGMGGIRVYADLNNNGKFDSNENYKFTNPDGSFTFVSLAPGAYVFRAVPPTGWRQTLPTNNFGQHVTLGAGGVVSGLQFGFAEFTQYPGAIDGFVFDDINGNGRQDDGEADLANWVAYLDLDNSGSFVAGDPTATTTASGFTFSNLAPGNYIVRMMPQAGWRQTTPANNFGWHVHVSDAGDVGGLMFGETQS